MNSDNYGSRGGSRLTVDTVANPLRFAAREYDSETGLYFMRARYYDPTLGRFISEDPLGLVAGTNQYLYVGGDPVTLTDPGGLGPCKEGQHIKRNEDGTPELDDEGQPKCVDNVLPPVNIYAGPTAAMPYIDWGSVWRSITRGWNSVVTGFNDFIASPEWIAYANNFDLYMQSEREREVKLALYQLNLCHAKAAGAGAIATAVATAGIAVSVPESVGGVEAITMFRAGAAWGAAGGYLAAPLTC